MVAARCGAFGSGSVESELMLWQVLGTMHHLDQTSISPLRFPMERMCYNKCHRGDQAIKGKGKARYIIFDIIMIKSINFS